MAAAEAATDGKPCEIFCVIFIQIFLILLFKFLNVLDLLPIPVVNPINNFTLVTYKL